MTRACDLVEVSPIKDPTCRRLMALDRSAHNQLRSLAQVQLPGLYLRTPSLSPIAGRSELTEEVRLRAPHPWVLAMPAQGPNT
jgi:hypothetical protein